MTKRIGNPSHKAWTEHDVKMLTKAYEGWPVVYPPALLKRHSHGACQHRAMHLGLTRRRLVARLLDHVTPTEWAYAAGIIDGEGTIRNYVPSTRSDANRGVSFVNTDKVLIDWMLRTFPGGSLGSVRVREGLKPLWTVRWMRAAVVAELLDGLMPFLIVKKEQAMRLRESLSEKFSALT